MQLDMFHTSTENFLYGEIEKVRESLDRRSRAMFAILTEMQDQLIKMQEKENKEESGHANAV